MFIISGLKKDSIKKYILLYGAIILCFAVVGFMVPDVTDLREEVDEATREAIRAEVTAETIEYMAEVYPYATYEEIQVAIAEAIDEEVAFEVNRQVAYALGAWVVIPAIFLIVYIFTTKRILEGLALVNVLCLIVGFKGGWFDGFNEVVLDVMMSEDIAWLLIVCGLMGGMVALIEKSGGGFAFANIAVKIAKTAKPTLLATAICSLLLSIDDYLSVLTSGSAMTPVNDRHKTPREMTAFVVDAAAAPASVLNPMSTWAIFIGGLMVANGLGEPGQQVLAYVRLLPYNFYAMAALLVTFLVIAGVIPKFGPMKGAYKRVAEGGPLAPAGSERYDMKAGAGTEVPKNPKLYNFLLPILVLVGATIFFDFDMQMGVITAVGFCFIFFIAQGMKPLEFMDALVSGIKNLVEIFVLLALTFSFAAICEEIGFIYFIVNLATNNLTPAMVPVTIFLIFALTEFIMGISWGMYVVAFPIAIPVAQSLGVDPYIAAGAVVCAGVWGSHSCFYSDSTLLTAASTGCDSFRHCITQIPYVLIAAVITTISFIVLGITLYG